MLIIEESQLNSFIEKLKKKFDFFDARDSILPAKQYWLPPIEEIFSGKKKNKMVPVKKPKEFIVFGLNSIDLEAIIQLDEIMKKPNEDYFYFQNRNQAILIGLVEEKMKTAPGGDIIFEKINSRQYKVWMLTPKGRKVIKTQKRFFKNIKEPTLSIMASTHSKNPGQAWSKSIRNLLLDSELLAEAVSWSKNHKIWDELKEKCLGCGICTYLCPLCYCFSIEDSVGFNGECKRCRKWDACTLPGFSKIAGGHNFRPSLRERYYNWFYHKFVRAYNEFGKSQCVGCGRCKENCPAQIDIYEVLKTILEDYKKEHED